MNTTAKTYFSLALFAGLLYPIMWRVINPEGFAIMFGGSWLSAAFTIGATAISAVAGIYLVGFLTVSANPSIFAGMVVRLGGSAVAGILSVFATYLMWVVEAGTLVGMSFSVAELLFTPAFISTFVGCWLTNLLVRFITPL